MVHGEGYRASIASGEKEVTRKRPVFCDRQMRLVSFRGETMWGSAAGST